MTVVIDTNIIISALLSPDSTAFSFLSDVLDGKYTVYISEKIYKEYSDVLHRKKFGFDETIIAFLLAWFEENAIWVEPNKSNFSIPDEKDRIFYDTARCTRSKLITGNFKHYPVDELVTALWEIQNPEKHGG